VIYTTNATLVGQYDAAASVARHHRIFPRRVKPSTKGSSLSMRTIAKKWTMPIHHWKPALNWFAVEFVERFPHDQKLFEVWSSMVP
jgi:putative transposase